MATKQTKVEIYGETSKYERSMRNVQRTSRSTSQTISSHWSKTFGTLTKLSGAFGIAGAAGFVMLGKNALDAADAIGKTADKVGIGTDALQEYRYAAKLSGVEQAQLDNGLAAFTKRLGEARVETGALVTYLNKYNETLLANIQASGSTEEALGYIFEAMGKATSASDRAALSAAAFGRTAGIDMTNLVREGTTGLQQMLQAARDLGLVIDESLIRESEKANDALTTLKSMVSIQMTSALISLAPEITGITQNMTDWIKANRQLIDQKVGMTINGITTSVKGIVDVYNSIPEGVIGPAGVGVVGRILFGSTPAGILAGSIAYVVTHIDDLKWSLDEISKFEKKGLIPFPLISVYQGLKDITEQTLLWLSSLTGVSSELENIKDSWMGRPLSSAMGPAAQVMSAATGARAQDLWESFGGGEETRDASWVASAYGFNQIEASTAEHFQRMKEMTDGNKMEIEALLVSHIAEKLMLQEQFNEQYNALGKSQYDLELENIQTMAEAYLQAGANKIQIAEWVAQKTKDISKQENAQRFADAQSAVGTMASNFQAISEMGGKQSKKAFDMYKAFKITETLMATYSSAIKAYESMVWVPYVGPALGAMAAAVAVAFGMAQVNMIRQAQPPSYDQGGISTTPGMYYSGIPEAHVPLKGGAIPVALDRGGGDTFNIIMNNPVFQDLETQQAVFANIATTITERVAPNAVYRAYDNDHPIRGLIRSRA